MQQVPYLETEPRNGQPVNGSNGTNGNHPPVQPVMLPMPKGPAEDSESGLDFGAIWNAFRRRWFLALSLGVVFGIPAAIGVWMLAPSPYVAFTELQLNSIYASRGDDNSPVADFNIWKQTVLKRASHPDILIEALAVPDVRKAQIVREHEPHAEAWLERELAIKPSGTEFIRIELEGEHPQELAAILKEVANALVIDVNDDLLHSRRSREAQLTARITRLNESIKSNKKRFEQLQGTLTFDPSQLDQEKTLLIDLTSSLRSSLVQLELERLRFLGQQTTNRPEDSQQQIDAIVEKLVEADPRFQHAATDVLSKKRQIHNQEQYLKQVYEAFSKTHPNCVQAEADLAKYKEELVGLTQTEKKVREELKTELMNSLPDSQVASLNPEDYFKKQQQVLSAAFEENKKNLTKELDELKIKSQELDRVGIQVRQIEKEIAREQDKMLGLQDDRDDLKSEIENTPELIEVIRKAEAPHTRSLKKKTMFSGVAGFGVFGLIVAGIVFLEFRTQRIGSIGEVSDKLNLRVMGAVPMLPRSATTGNSVKKKAKNAIWYSALTEAVDSTRTLLVRGSQMESLKTVMLASAVGGEGKTTMASHLATSLARGGRRILLVDCDLRRPCLHRAFGLPPGQGVCEILRGEAHLEECIQHLESPAGLSILPAGKINQQVLKLLALDSLGEMLEPLKKEYDFIIIDTSPLLPVTDGLLVAQHVDGVILSIRRDVSRIGKVVLACQKLSMLGVPLLGAVTIGLQDAGGYQRKYGYNYYGYGQRQHYYTQPPPV